MLSSHAQVPPPVSARTINAAHGLQQISRLPAAPPDRSRKCCKKSRGGEKLGGKMKPRLRRLHAARCASAVRAQRCRTSTLTFWCVEPLPTASLTTKARMAQSICISTEAVMAKERTHQCGSLVVQRPALPQPPTSMGMAPVHLLGTLPLAACCHPMKPCGG